MHSFQNKIILDPMTFSEARFRPSLEERLESIISGAALMADSSCTRDDRRERIVAECNAVRQALQDLLSEYMNNVSLLLLCSLFRGFGVKLLWFSRNHAWTGQRRVLPNRGHQEIPNSCMVRVCLDCIPDWMQTGR